MVLQRPLLALLCWRLLRCCNLLHHVGFLWPTICRRKPLYNENDIIVRHEYAWYGPAAIALTCDWPRGLHTLTSLLPMPESTTTHRSDLRLTCDAEHIIHQVHPTSARTYDRGQFASGVPCMPWQRVLAASQSPIFDGAPTSDVKRASCLRMCVSPGSGRGCFQVGNETLLESQPASCARCACRNFPALVYSSLLFVLHILQSICRS
jgi:hypothetical protein